MSDFGRTPRCSWRDRLGDALTSPPGASELFEAQLRSTGSGRVNKVADSLLGRMSRGAEERPTAQQPETWRLPPSCTADDDGNVVDPSASSVPVLERCSSLASDTALARPLASETLVEKMRQLLKCCFMSVPNTMAT